MRFALLILAGMLAACGTPPPTSSPPARPGPSDGTHYVLAGEALLTCNTYGFDTVCR